MQLPVTTQGEYTFGMQKRRGCLVQVVVGLAFGLAVIYGAMLLTSPWSLHIGGRLTPLLTWQGTGKLITKGGAEYPIYLYLFPSPHFSRLRLNGLRPTGGLQGEARLCTAPGVSERLKLSGTIYGGWSSTENSVMAFRLNEIKSFDVGQKQGYFDLSGRWQGQELVMDEHGAYAGQFRSGLRIENASVKLNWGSYSDFKAACANATKLPAR